jgi:hypothetical protein
VNCTETQGLLDAYIDGELELHSSLTLEAHLQGCARCSARAQGLHALRGALSRACEPAVAPRSLRQSVRGGLAQATSAAPKTRGLWLAAAPGVAGLLVAGWLLITQPWHVPHSMMAAAPDRVVYHIAGGENIDASLRTLKNHLDATPGLHVVVVAHNDGIRFLLDDARDGSGQAYGAVLRELRNRGVEFRVCTNTLTRRQIDTRAVVPEAVLVPSGIAEISRLQGREGYTYLRL